MNVDGTKIEELGFNYTRPKVTVDELKTVSLKLIINNNFCIFIIIDLSRIY